MGINQMSPVELVRYALESSPSRGGNIIDRMALEAALTVMDTECPNGWLAMLPDGCPVAIPVDEFRRYGRWQPDAEEATA